LSRFSSLYASSFLSSGFASGAVCAWFINKQLNSIPI
jgi:hypothetical protein